MITACFHICQEMLILAITISKLNLIIITIFYNFLTNTLHKPLPNLIIYRSMLCVKKFDDNISSLTAAEHHGHNELFPGVVHRNL